MPRAQHTTLQAITLFLVLIIGATNSWAKGEDIPVCRAEQNPAFALQKSIAVLNIAVDDSEGMRDMPELGLAVAQYLQQGLKQGQTMRVRDGSRHYFTKQRVNLLGLVETDLKGQLSSLSRELDSQLIVSGRITDLSITPRKGVIDQVLAYLSFDEGDSRVFAIELTVHDSYSGVALLQRQYQTQASGSVNMQGMEPLKGRFLSTSYGQAIATLLNDAAQQLQDELSCIPMMTRIKRIEKNKIFIDEGHESMLRAGDRLRLFHRQHTGVDKMGNERFIEEFVGDAHVTRLFPNSAVLEYSGSKLPSRLKSGDIVRAW